MGETISVVQELQRKLSYAHSLTRIKLRSQPYQYLFILSHMRSGSTLLVHLLNTHPEIFAYGEAHLSYHSVNDLNRLVCKAKHHLQDWRFDERYIVDKVLHRNHVLDADLIRSQSCAFVFLVREPKGSLNSMLKLRQRPSHKEKQAADYYTRYYIERLDDLMAYGRSLPETCCKVFITHDQLIKRTDEVFGLLSQGLAIDNLFSEEYQLSAATGVRGIGDPSERIKQGRILRNAQPSSLETKIDGDLLERAQGAFQCCEEALSLSCKTLSSEAI
jgi:Sulfotransferase family